MVMACSAVKSRPRIGDMRRETRGKSNVRSNREFAIGNGQFAICNRPLEEEAIAKCKLQTDNCKLPLTPLLGDPLFPRSAILPIIPETAPIRAKGDDDEPDQHQL